MKNKIRNTLAGIVLGLTVALSSCASFSYPNPTKISHEIGKEYKGAVVFVTDHPDFHNYYDDIVMKTIMNQLQNDEVCKDGTINYSINDWFELQAKKYGKDIKIDLEAYPEKLLIPQKFIDHPGKLDDGRPQEYDLDSYLKYLRSTHPDLRKYDFIAIESPHFHGNVENRGVNSRSDHGFYVTLQNSPAGFENRNATFAHELTHILGGENKYETLKGKFWIPNPDYPYKNDIMYKTSQLHALKDTSIICPQTAKEMGWINN
jgi:hypothetical protein